MALGKKTGGRRPGSLNKTTASAKEAFALAFEGVGGVPKLIKWAGENETEFYKLFSKLIPQDVTSTEGFNITVTTGVPRAD